jgi:hypothetical protein
MFFIGEIDAEPGEFQLLSAPVQEFLALGLGHGFGETGASGGSCLRISSSFWADLSRVGER